MKEKRSSKFQKLITLLFAAIAVSFALIFSVSKAYALDEKENAGNYTFYSDDAFINYARAFNDNGYNAYDTITLNQLDSTYWNLPTEGKGFTGLGTSTRPFRGKIIITDSAVKEFYLEAPLLNCATTEAKIVKSPQEGAQTQTITIRRIKSNANPILIGTLKNVAGYSSDFNVISAHNAMDSDNELVCNTGSLIGEIEDGADVTITFTNNNTHNSIKSNMSSNGDIGMIAGTVGEDVTLTISSISGTNTEYDITTTGNNKAAGGLVGRMGEGSSLIMPASFTSITTVNAVNGYAGGLIGYSNSSIVNINSSTVVINKNITGGYSTGGIFGYYINSDSAKTFDLKNVTITNASLIKSQKGEGATGGIFGTLISDYSINITDSTTNIENDSNYKIEGVVRGNNTYKSGSLIGYYSNSGLTNTLSIYNEKVNTSINSGLVAGLIGKIDDSNPAYIDIHNVRVKAASGAFDAGLINDMGTAGSFLDLSNSVIIKGNAKDGIVDLLNEGVIRIKGTTDLSEISYESSAAQLVGRRGNGLIYALGSGANSNWTFKRRSSSQDNIYVDDIGDWGQVLRIDSSYNTLNESDFFIVDDTNHTVTLLPHVQSMGNIVSFIKTALNIQLNIEDKGALKFSSSSRSTTILSSNLSITANIDLIHTGIVSFQRDNGESEYYTGTFNGNGNTIKLALGEAYGVVNGSAKTEANNGYNYFGTVHDHHYVGLFANTNNAALTNVTIDGFIHSKASSTNFGPLAASIKSTSSSTISNITSKTAIYSYARGGAANVGGVIGRINDSSTGTISISDITAENNINEIRTAAGGVRYGGVIATIDSVNTLTLNLDTINLKGTFTNTSSSTYSSFVYGGLIGFIKQDRGNLNRTINLTNITVSNGFNATYKTTSGTATASILGGTWHDALVYFGTTSSNGITINNTSSSITVNSGSSNSRIGVLVGRGSGKWYVNDINVTNLTVTSNVSSKLGFIVYDAYTNVDTAYSGLYLIVKRSDFDIASAVFSGTYSTFDEICGNSIITTDGNILSNGQAIISLENASNAALAMDGSNCNTYQNVTAYGKTNQSINPSTRYYYNVDCILNKETKTNADKFFIWSIKSYAHSTIAPLFTGGFTNTNITGILDMTGYSYYPINIAQTVTISSASIKLVNSLIEASEAGSENSDSTIRSTHVDNQSQHYMMHEGMFINVTGTLSISTLSIAGDISNYDSRSGFIALGTVGGLDSTQITINLSNITLDGAKVTFKGGTTDAPLLLNRILKNTSITLNGCVASASGYDSFTYPAASSLFGDAGDSLATNINITFSSLTLDSRKTAGIKLSAYHTTRSLFSKATLLNSLVYVNGQAVYNFERSEDWGSGNQVTYGYELTGSVEYAGKESMYYNDTVFYVDPTNSAATSAYNFSTGYLPYVFTAYSQANKCHEVRVNVKDSAEISGCGKYNDPYIIETNKNYTGSELLNAIANIIKGTPTNGTKITLPDTLISDTDAWCSNNSSDHLYTYNGTAFERTDDVNTTKSLADVRLHLSKAYYLIKSNITLDDGYIGLGVLDANEDTYMFRGVIVGQNSNITITNNSSNPLVFASNGCVIKDLTVVVNKNIELTLAATSTLSPQTGSMPAYGALIGRVFGGDNIIDNVNVRYDKSITLTGNFTRLIPVGGYVGAVVSGGLIFRNMNTDEGGDIDGLPNTKCSYISNETYYYVNPIIGRVIAGYSFTEKSEYVYSESNVTMKNGLKNYGICDINSSSSNKISTTGSKFQLALTVPDAQSLFILSCIVNSGAGSASVQTSASVTAYADMGTSLLAGYRNTSETRTALYNHVGTTEPNSANVSDYQTVITYDKSDTRNKIPYIIKQYTNTDGGYYRTRSICGNGSNAGVGTITLSNVTYNLPAGFRGIGGIYVDANYYKLRFRSINGNNAVINFNMSYYEYDVSTNGENYKANASNTGFGLFNSMYHNSASDTNTIKNLTLSGSITYDIRKRSNGNIIVYAPHTPESSQWYTSPYTSEDLIASSDTNLMSNSGVLNLGGLCGCLQGTTNIQNVTMNNLTINGAKFAGGLIGYSSAKTITIKNPSATNLSVTGGFSGGGLIGGFYGNGNLTITGEENSHAILDINKISVKGHAARAKLFADGFGYNFKCAGALIGYVSTGTNNTLTINYVDVVNGAITIDDEGYYNDANVDPTKTHIANLRYKCMIGGICGEVKNSNIVVDSITISEVNMRGEVAGGIFGFISDSVYGTIENISLSNETKKTIDGTNIAGGFIGIYYPTTSATKSIVFKTITVSNYDILSSGQNAERCAAGGLLGLCYWSSSKNLSLENILLEKIKIEKTNSYKNEKTEYLGFGGLAGTVTNRASGTAGSITGYNILLNDVTLNIQNQCNKPGILIGVNSASGECRQLDVKIAGISIQNSSGANEIVGTYRTVNGNKQYYGDYGYVVFADYNGISASEDDSDINKDHAFLYDSQNDIEEELPYVNVNSSVYIADDQLLTGDGMSKTKEELVINDIVSANGTGYYAYSSQSLVDFNIGKLSTFNDEQYLVRSNDFAVLIVDETSRDKTTALVNAYLNLLANTKFDYGTDYAINNVSVFDVSIYRMQYNEGNGTFTKLNTEANLKRADGKFYMLITDIDTSGTDKTFSLIDVKFKDPNDPDKIAYHLYVPVIVKKMFKYEFRIATGTGTTYDYSWYDDNNRFGVNLMENLGTPTTIYFEYEYERSKADWLDAIRNGENLIRNYNKYLNMQRISASNLDVQTVMVLVDIQNGGKPYYARFNNSVYSTNMLNLQGFRETLTANGSTGTAFAPIDLTDMLNITATVSAEGTFMVDNVNPTIRAHYNGDIINLRLATESDAAGTRYTVDIDDGGEEMENIKECYYISFFTHDSNTNILYQYNITVPSTFGVPQYPSRLDHQDDIENRIRLIFGNIFVQEGFEVNTFTQEEITETNNTINIEMKSTVSIASGVKDEVVSYLSTDVLSFYQSFLVMLEKREASSTTRIIAGEPNVNGRYGINSTAFNRETLDYNILTAYTSDQIFVSSNFIEFRNSSPLNSFLVVENGKAYIFANVYIEYDSLDNIILQFPNKENPEDRTTGVRVFASSNLAFQPEVASFSKISITDDDISDKLYYCSAESDKAILYFDPLVDDQDANLGALGINPLDMEGTTQYVYGNAVLDLSLIIDQTYNNYGLANESYKYDSLRLTVQLTSKESSYDVANDALDISTYMSDIWLRGIDTNTNGYFESKTGNMYTFIVPRSLVENSSNKEELEVKINFIVKTGQAFEGLNHYYSNYKITLTANLVKVIDNNINNLDLLESSTDTNYIIYTNAKVIPDFVE